MATRQRMLVFHLREARRKAQPAAVAEALALLQDLDASAPAGGPFAERGGVFWITVAERHLEAASARLPRLGYTSAVDLLVPVDQAPGLRRAARPDTTTWKRRRYRLLRLYQEDAAALRDRAPDRRVFLLETGDGQVRAVRGYRTSGSPLTHRALPVCDARLLVNLVAQAAPGVLLDPFAGAGGIALEALENGWTTVTADVDPVVRHGLSQLGAAHVVADARSLPLRSGTLDAVATEPPYDQRVGTLVSNALVELHRLLRAGGRIALLCAAWQAADLRATASELGLHVSLDCPINRKGLDVVVLAWRK